MSQSSYESPSAPMSSGSLVRSPFQRSDKKVKKSMRTVPDTLRTAAAQLLERVRVGLDIPSRTEVLDLASRIGAIAEKLDALETKRSADSQLVEELRAAKAETPKLTRQPSIANSPAPASSMSSLAKAAESLSKKPKARAAGPAKPKAKGPAKAKAKGNSKEKSKTSTKGAAKPAANSKSKAGRSATKAATSPKKAKATKRSNGKSAGKSAGKTSGSKKR